MYWKLAIQNIRRSLRDYIIYFVTLTFTALCDVLLFRDELFYYESFGLFAVLILVRLAATGVAAFHIYQEKRLNRKYLWIHTSAGRRQKKKSRRMAENNIPYKVRAALLLVPLNTPMPTGAVTQSPSMALYRPSLGGCVWMPDGSSELSGFQK